MQGEQQVTENSYAATATAEKRLREVLADRFGPSADVDALADALLEDAEIEYLPRKKSVSIRLMVPETASTKPKLAVAVGAEQAVTILDDPTDGRCPRCGGDGCPACSAAANDTPVLGVTTVGDVRAAADLPHDRGSVVPFTPLPAAVDYDDDFFTE